MIKQWFFNPSTKSNEPLGVSTAHYRRDHAGVSVNENTVATHGDVWTCIKILSSSVGQIPLSMTREEGEKREVIKGKLISRIFTEKPCDYLTSQQWLEMCIACLALRGNFYAEIVRNRYGNIAKIVPFYNQNGVTVRMNDQGRLVYTYVTNTLRTGKYEKFEYSAESILHIKINTLDGIAGTSVITNAARELGISLATEQHTASIFKNDATPKMIMETDASFGDNIDAFNRLKDDVNSALKGSKNSGKTLILENGLKAKPISLSPIDSELISQRILSREKVYAMFGIPLHRGDVRGGKYGNVEQSNRAFVTETLAPYLCHIENALNELLPDNFRVKFDLTRLLKAESKTLTEITTKQFSMGLITINEARELLGFDKLEGADLFAVQTNNLRFGGIDEFTKPPEEPKPTEPQQGDRNDENQQEDGV